MGTNLHRYGSCLSTFFFSACYTTIQEQKQNRNSDAQFTYSNGIRKTLAVFEQISEILYLISGILGEKNLADRCIVISLEEIFRKAM